MEEKWKLIKNFENYEISNLGRVRRIAKGKNTFVGKIKSTSISNSGYEIVILSKYKKNYGKTIHRLVAEAFIPNPNNYSDVDHIDSNKLNNIVTNLRWLSHKENTNKWDRTNAIQKQKETWRLKRELNKQILKERYVKYSYYLIDGKKYKTRKEYANETNKSLRQVVYYLRKNNIKKISEYKKEYYY